MKTRIKEILKINLAFAEQRAVTDEQCLPWVLSGADYRDMADLVPWIWVV